jgi:mono/diheme cytochrome c family protein
MFNLCARVTILACAVAAMVCALRWAPAQTALADGTAWFSADQVGSGRLAYAQNCAVCHGTQLQGGGAPGLSGRGFVAQWNGKTVKSLFSYVSQNMPLGKAGSLQPQQYADIVAYILSKSGVPA